MKLEFSGQFFKKILNYQISWNFIQWELSCPTQTDMMKLIVTFRNSQNAPKNLNLI